MFFPSRMEDGANQTGDLQIQRPDQNGDIAAKRKLDKEENHQIKLYSAETTKPIRYALYVQEVLSSLM